MTGRIQMGASLLFWHSLGAAAEECRRELTGRLLGNGVHSLCMAQMHTIVCTSLHTFTHPHTIHLYMCTHTHSQTVYVHMHTHTHPCSYTHKHMGIHTLIHPHLQTHTHTVIHDTCTRAHNAHRLKCMITHTQMSINSC